MFSWSLSTAGFQSSVCFGCALLLSVRLVCMSAAVNIGCRLGCLPLFGAFLMIVLSFLIGITTAGTVPNRRYIAISAEPAASLAIAVLPLVNSWPSLCSRQSVVILTALFFFYRPVNVVKLLFYDIFLPIFGKKSANLLAKIRKKCIIALY